MLLSCKMISWLTINTLYRLFWQSNDIQLCLQMPTHANACDFIDKQWMSSWTAKKKLLFILFFFPLCVSYFCWKITSRRNLCSFQLKKKKERSRDEGKGYCLQVYKIQKRAGMKQGAVASRWEGSHTQPVSSWAVLISFNHFRSRASEVWDKKLPNFLPFFFTLPFFSLAQSRKKNRTNEPRWG